MVPPHSSFTSCVHGQCGTKGDALTLCRSLQAYASLCAQAGRAPAWRNSTFCREWPALLQCGGVSRACPLLLSLRSVPRFSLPSLVLSPHRGPALFSTFQSLHAHPPPSPCLLALGAAPADSHITQNSLPSFGYCIFPLLPVPFLPLSQELFFFPQL